MKNPVGNGRPCTYIACTAPLYAPLEGVRQWVKRQSGWRWQEIATGHDAMVTAPAELAGCCSRSRSAGEAKLPARTGETSPWTTPCGC